MISIEMDPQRLVKYAGRVVNYIFFYVGWGVCLQQSSEGHPFIGPLIVAPMLLFHFLTMRPFVPELIVITTVALFNTFVDTLFLWTGLIEYNALYPHFPYIAPPWLTAIWVLYAMCLNHSLSWMGRFPKSAGILGGGAAVLCYKAAESFGSIRIAANETAVLAVIGVFWAIYFPLSLYCSRTVMNSYYKKIA